MDWKNRKKALVRGHQLCTQLCIFEGSLAELLRFWCCQLWKMKKSRRIVSFLTLLSSKIEEVSQNCFVFDCCQLWKMKKSRRIVSFLTLSSFKHWGSLAELLRCLMLSSSKPEDVSQNSFVFRLADRQVDRQTNRQTDRERKIDR